MTDPDSPAENQNEQDKPFWTWDMKVLVTINIVFLLVIAGGVITVLSALSPTIYHYILRAFS